MMNAHLASFFAVFAISSACNEARDHAPALTPVRDGGEASATPPAHDASGIAADAELPADASAASDNPYRVQSYGRLYEIMHNNDTAARVTLASLEPKNLFAVGALSELRGEVTIADGAPWISYDDGRGGVRIASELDEKATLLVAANVASFRELAIEADVAWTDLDRTITEKLRAAGYDVNVRIPLRIEGPVRELSYHVLKGASGADAAHSHHGHAMNALRGTIASGEVSLIGFYSQHDQGVFTHMGSSTHFHVIDVARRIAGHVDSAIVAHGSRLLVPEAPVAR